MEVYERIYNIVKDKLSLNEIILPEDNLMDDLGADSLDLVELAMSTEEEFDIEITDREAEMVTTMSDFADLVELKLKG